MLLFIRLVAVSLVPLVGMAESSLAQSNPSPHEVVPRLLQQTRIDDITEDPARIVVHASRVRSAGQGVSRLLIVCDRSGPDREWLVVQDHTLKTDDRLGVEPGFCDAVLTLARQHQDAQRR